MLYAIMKVVIGFYRFFFCRCLVIDKPDLLKEKGPLILACNHPNSFLDAILIDLVMKEPVWSLTRGDAFISGPVKKIFHKLRMLPVYRTSEGPENLEENYRTFDACREIFRNNGVVLIFSEGLCENEWHLRNLKKGTARLAIQCQDAGIPLKILPVGINYSSFRRFGKNVFLHFGNITSIDAFDKNQGEGARYQAFNNWLYNELKPLVYEIEKEDREAQTKRLYVFLPPYKRALLSLPALPGLILHAPLYLPVKYFVMKKYRDTVHVDSLLTALPFFLYPFYLVLLFLLIFFLTQSWWSLLLFLLMPFCAWAFIQIKRQLDNPL